MWYRVLAKEVHVVSVLIEAEDEDEALALVKLQEGLEEYSEFIEALDGEEEVYEAEDVDEDGNYLDDPDDEADDVYDEEEVQ